MIITTADRTPYLADSIIIIKDLKSINEDRLHHLRLPPSIPNITTATAPGSSPTHKRRSPHDSQILARHAIHAAVLRHPIQMQRQDAEGRVVGVGERVDDGVEGVAAEDVVGDLGGGDEFGVVLSGE